MIKDMVSASCELQSYVIAVEYASSSQHPWTGRVILQRALEYEGSVILTANPDRLSRRAGELEELMEELEDSSITWLSQGLVDRSTEALDGND